MQLVRLRAWLQVDSLLAHGMGPVLWESSSQVVECVAHVQLAAHLRPATRGCPAVMKILYQLHVCFNRLADSILAAKVMLLVSASVR